MRRALLSLAGFLSIGLVLAAWLLRPPSRDDRPHPFNQDRNATWLEHRWLEREHGVPELETLFRRLKDHGVQYAFPHVIPFNAAGRLPVHSREQMRRFLQTARRVSPELKILPWVGGLRVGYRRTRAGTLDLADLGQRQRMLAECRGLVDEGFDGIHLNVEPVDDGNVDFLALLRALRNAVGPERVLSLAAIKPGPFAVPLAPNLFWTSEYYGRVAALADQVVVMAYDTGMPAAGLYQRYVAYAASAATTTFARRKARARLLIGVPTYDYTGVMHRAGVETPENAILGVISGLRGLGAGGTFEGIALYAEWTTDDKEWSVYERLWRGKGPGN